MKAALHDLWGCGRGLVSGIAPRSRILAGALAFGSCMVSPAATPAGFALTATVVVFWLLGCRPPRTVIAHTLGFALSLFLPALLLVPVMAGGLDPSRWTQELPVVAELIVHGIAGVLISVITVTTLTATDLREGLTRLPIPRLVSAILLQIVHQSALLGGETRRVAAAMSVRGASGGGIAAWRMVSSLPRVWLPRVILRAERVASAMEVRGYCDRDLPTSDRSPERAADALVLASSVLALAAATWLRLGGCK